MASLLLQRFLNFDRLIGPRLVKIVYYVGAVMIVLGVAATMLTAFFAMAGGDFGAGLMQLLAGPVVGAVALVFWRFSCELFMLSFLTYERLGQVRETLRIAAGEAPTPAAAAQDQNHPAF